MWARRGVEACRRRPGALMPACGTVRYCRYRKGLPPKYQEVMDRLARQHAEIETYHEMHNKREVCGLGPGAPGRSSVVWLQAAAGAGCSASPPSPPASAPPACAPLRRMLW